MLHVSILRGIAFRNSDNNLRVPGSLRGPPHTTPRYGFFDDKSERVMEVLNVVNALYPWLQSRDTETFKSYVKKKNQLVRHDQS